MNNEQCDVVGGLGDIAAFLLSAENAKKMPAYAWLRQAGTQKTQIKDPLC